MDRILSDEELDALLRAAQGLKDGGAAPGPAARPKVAPGEAVPYDLTSQGRPVRGPLPALDMVDDRFVRHLRATLTGSLRRRVEATADGRSFVKFEEVSASTPTPSCLVLFRSEPLRATGLVHFDPALVYAVLDAFFGARSGGDEDAKMRELTTIEQRILTRVAKALLDDLAKAWRPILDLAPEILRLEPNPAFVTAIPPHAVIVDTRVSLDLDGRPASLRTLIPYTALEPLTDRLASGVHGAEAGDGTARERIWTRLRETRVRVHAELGRGSISVRELLALKPGDVLPLGGSADGGAVVRVEGAVKAVGKPISARGAYAVRVEQRLTRAGER